MSEISSCLSWTAAVPDFLPDCALFLPGTFLQLERGLEHPRLPLQCVILGCYNGCMSLQEIESAIEQLTPDELSEPAACFEEYHAQAWDRQIEEDIQAGKLDKLAEQARAEFTAGRCKGL